MGKQKFTREEIESLFEDVIKDLKHNCYKDKGNIFYLGQKKLDLIRYLLSVRIDNLIRIKKLEGGKIRNG